MKTSLKIGIVVTVLVAAAMPPMLTYWQGERALRQERSILRNQDQEIVAIAVASQAVSNLILNASLSTSQLDRTAELEKLREQARILRGRVERARKQMPESRQMARDRFSELSGKVAEHNHTVPYGRWVMGKPNDALAITDALLRYAREHDGQLPANLGQAANYLPQPHSQDNSNAPISGTNEFDIVYTGSLRDLDNVLPETVALIREHEAWQTTEGKWARIYGYADGSASRVESDDDFKSWDAVHVVPSGVSN